MNMKSIFPFLDALEKINGVYYDDVNRLPDLKEKLYKQVRNKEQRMYTDQEVRVLPSLDHHVHSAEWSKRKRSAKRIWNYFEQKPDAKILDLGCGNGWFTHRLAIQGGHSVLGLDLNIAELEQAARLFSNAAVFFLYGDVFSKVISPGSFDYVTVGAAIQYFDDVPGLINRLMELLKPGGEIHVFDSPWYLLSNVDQARERSKSYYIKLGFPAMSNHYFHHTLEDLKEYQPTILYMPRTHPVFRLVFKNRDIPFPWIQILKANNEKD